MERKKAGFGRLLKLSFVEMRKNDPLRMAGATAFFTTFALPPILIILFQVFTLFLDRKFVGGGLRQILIDTLGTQGAEQIRVTTRGFRSIASNWYIATAGFLFLVFVATTLFSVVKNTLNDIWKISIGEKPGVLFYLSLRARSFAVIVLAGILFMAGLMLDGFEVLAGKYMETIFPGGGKFFKGALNEITSAVIVVSWFVLLFRYLADARPVWRVSLAGGILTGILYSGGKALLSYLMLHSNIAAIYGPSGATVLILLFVFYSSFILYYGASFIKVYSELSNQPLRPVGNAFQYQLQRVKK